MRVQAWLLSGLARLPLGLLYVLSTVGSFVAFHWLRWRRELVTKNLASAFPDLAANELDVLA